jgi:sarcosine oxidase
MRWDAVVVGLGVMGSAALAELARRGLNVLGLERFDIPHGLGSSHGGTRVIRKAYYEHPGYVPLLERSWEAWRRLEAEVGETLLIRTGGLHFGPRDCLEIQDIIGAARAHGLSHEVLDAAGISARHPVFRPGPTDIGVLEHDAGLLFAERCVASLVQVAMRRGATVMARQHVVALDRDGSRLTLRLADGTRHEAERVVLALGPWWPGSSLLPAPVPLEVERQVQCWVRPRVPEAFQPERFPVFLRFGESLIYGLPEAYHPGLKVAQHHGGARFDAAHVDTVHREVSADDLAPVRRFLSAHLPDADGPLLGARVCMYTNTPDGHFALGPHPDEPRVIAATGFSGHGFKLAPAVGEILADQVVSGSSALMLDLFRHDRFASGG